jgi:hypothetical protein
VYQVPWVWKQAYKIDGIRFNSFCFAHQLQVIL